MCLSIENRIINLIFVDTDYENYSIGYECINLRNNKSKENFWLFASQPSLPESVQSKVEAVVKKIADRKLLRGIKNGKTRCKM